MIIVKIMGGLGNQMFQYALYEKLKSLGKRVKTDTESFYRHDNKRKYELNKFPRVETEEASQKEKEYYFQYAGSWHHKIEGKLFESRKKVRSFEGFQYCEDVYKVEDAYISGFWQSEKYFESITNIIRERFQFEEPRDLKNLKFLDQIKTQNSVAIHVRRGDYLSPVNQKIYGNICTERYYKEAINYFENKFGDVTFFVFSNDTEWVRNNLKMKKAVIVDGNDGEKAIFDMLLMANCRHNIIANSSFSWWGAWLNRNAEKKVIAPSKWVNTEKVEDIWCKEWIKMDG